ncbi:MAG: hypothetical protein VX874_00225 [Pseudomonadota bacterium]|nr:hypothetical protein [Pseudomonadota bacterium]
MSDNVLTIRRSDLLGFAYGALGTVFIQVGGQLYGSELLALTLIILVGPLTIIRATPALNSILAGYAILMVGLAFADLANGSRTSDAIRGAANVLFAAANLFFLTHVFQRSTRAILFVLLGQSLSHVIGADATQEFLTLENSNDFKARIVPVLTPLVLIASYRLMRIKPALAITALFSTGLLYLLLEARSKGVVLMGGTAIVLLYRARFKRGQKVFVVAAGLALVYGLYVIYVNDVLSTPSSANSYMQLSRASNPYNPFSLLAEGRSESIVALAAIEEHPIVGRGSWARDLTGKYNALFAQLKGQSVIYQSPFIVSHSVILTAWMWGGLLGLAGIMIVWWSIFRKGLRLIVTPSPYQLIIAVLFVDFVWHSIFSPFGHIRTSFPVIGAFIIAYAPALAPRKANLQASVRS